MSLLITSFAPWKAHQKTNSSDDLLALLQAQRRLPTQSMVIRRLPVHSQLAPCEVLSAVLKQRPKVVVCCGMAETRSLLNLEQYAHHRHHRLETTVNLHQLCAKTQWTCISHDAGNYVCNDLYYQLLTHFKKHDLPVQCLFVHVPRLTVHNQEPLARDLATILAELVQRQWASTLNVA